MKILKNLGWLFLEKILRLLVGVIVAVWFARYLKPELYGSYNFAFAYVGFFSVIAGLGLQGIVVRELIVSPDKKEEIIGTAMILLAISAVIAYILALLGIYLIRENDHLVKMLVVVLGLTMLFNLNSVTQYWFESQTSSKNIVWAQSIAILISAILKVILMLNGANVMAFAWATVFDFFLMSSLMFIVLNWKGIKLKNLTLSIERGKTLINDSWPLFLSSIATMIYMKTDQIMLGLLLDDQSVGIYGAASRITEIFYIIPIVIASSLFPYLVEIRKRSQSLFNEKMQSFYILMVWMAISIAVPISILSDEIIKLLYGELYATAAEVLTIQIWAAIFVFLGVAGSNWFVMENLQKLSIQRTIVGAIINIILNFILIPDYGPAGAAYGTVIAQMVVCLLYDIFLKETRSMFTMKLKAFNPFLMLKMIFQNNFNEIK